MAYRPLPPLNMAAWGVGVVWRLLTGGFHFVM